MTQQTNGTPELKYSEEAFRDMYEALKEASIEACKSCKETEELAMSEGLNAYPCEEKCEFKLGMDKALALAEWRK